MLLLVVLLLLRVLCCSACRSLGAVFEAEIGAGLEEGAIFTEESALPSWTLEPEITERFQWTSRPESVLRKQVFRLKIIEEASALRYEYNRLSNPRYFSSLANPQRVESHQDNNRFVYVSLVASRSVGPNNGYNEAFWNIKTVEQNTTKQQVNYTVTDSQLKQCYNSLGISRTTESQLVYLCYLWSQQPHVVTWVFLAFFSLIYGLLPASVTMLYVRNIRSEQRTGFVAKVPKSVLMSKNRKSPSGAALLLLCVIATVTISLLVSCCVYFFKFAFDQTIQTHQPSNIVFVNSGARSAITSLSLISFLLLSLLKPEHAFNDLIMVKKILHICEAPTSRCMRGVVYFAFSIPLSLIFILELANNSTLKISFLFLHGISFLISDILTYFVICICKCFNPTLLSFEHTLTFAYLNDTEKAAWISKVDQYTECISATMRRDCFFNSLLRRASLPPVLLEGRPSSLHTGSIPSQFGKPLMLLGDLQRVVSDSFPELRSDHDVMFSLEHLPVSETRDGQAVFRAEVSTEPGTEEFVCIYDNREGGLAHCVKNTEATDYMVNVVKETFFTADGELTEAARSLPVLIDSREACHCLTAPLYKDLAYKFLVERAGPSVNLKVTVHRGRVVFDCDLLLSLPLTQWPSPAREWLTRPRQWPHPDIVTSLAALPCHLIPKPREAGDSESWRFSFSNQELQLAAALPHKARLCYVGLKYVFKKRLNGICPSLKSYHMLTAFLWFMEQQDPRCWEEGDEAVEQVWEEGDENTLVDNIELDTCIAGNRQTKEILVNLLSHIICLLRSGRLPHYFIRKVNLHPATTRTAGLQLLTLVEKMEVLVKHGLESSLKETLVHNVSALNPGLVKRLLEDRNGNNLSQQDTFGEHEGPRISQQTSDGPTAREPTAREKTTIFNMRGRGVLEPGAMDDPVRSKIGNFGRWQAKRIIMMSCVGLIYNWQLLSTPFINPTQDYWCSPPELGLALGEKPFGYNSTQRQHDCNRRYPKEGYCYRWDFNRSVSNISLATSFSTTMCGLKERYDQLEEFSKKICFTVWPLISGFLSDRFGRQKLIIFACLGVVIFGSSSTCSPELHVFLTLRICTLVCCLTMWLNGYVYCMEMVGGVWIPIVGAGMFLPMDLGTMILPMVGRLFPTWTHLQLAISLPCLLLLLALLLPSVLPESPRWQLARGKKEKVVQKTLTIARKENGLAISEFKVPGLPTMKLDKDKKLKQDSFRDLFRHKSAIFRNQYTMYFLWIADCMVYYGLVMSTNSPFQDYDLQTHWIISGCLGIVSTLLACLGLIFVGRKTSIFAALTFGALCLVLIPFLPIAGKRPLALLGRYVVEGSMVMVHVYTVELFPTTLRGKALGHCYMAKSIGSALAISWAPPIFGYSYRPDSPLPFILALPGLLAALLVLRLPETRNHPLPDSLAQAERFSREHRPATGCGTRNAEYQENGYRADDQGDVIQTSSHDSTQENNHNENEELTCNNTQNYSQEDMIDDVVDPTFENDNGYMEENTF